MTSQHCHYTSKHTIQFDVWVKLLLTNGFRNGKTRNGQVCWVSAFPADRALQ
jgi:hypothetical protein